MSPRLISELKLLLKIVIKKIGVEMSQGTPAQSEMSFIKGEREEQPWQPGAGLVLRARPRHSVEHRQLYRTPASDKAILWRWWVKTKTRPLRVHIWADKTHTLSKKENAKPPLTGVSANRSDCCFFTSHSFSLPLVCLPLDKIYSDNHEIIPSFRNYPTQSEACFFGSSSNRCQSPNPVVLSNILLRRLPQFPLACLLPPCSEWQTQLAQLQVLPLVALAREYSGSAFIIWFVSILENKFELF